jgi:hypothetical protein
MVHRDLAKMEKVGSDNGDGKCDAFVSSQGEVMQVRVAQAMLWATVILMNSPL